MRAPEVLELLEGRDQREVLSISDDCLAKLQSLAEGARRASQQLWSSG